MGKWRDRTMQPFKANGISYNIQMRSLNWQEIDARAEAIVSDPLKRISERQRRSMGALDDPKPKKDSGRGKGHRPRVPGER